MKLNILVLILSIVLFIFVLLRKPKMIEIEPLEPIYVKNRKTKMIMINLDKRKDRLDSVVTSFIQSDLKKHVDLYRLPAINGREKIDEIRPLLTRNAEDEYSLYLKTGKRVGHHSLTDGGMGCYMSHVTAWKCVKQMNSPCIVAEDDIDIPHDAYENITDIIKTTRTISKTRPCVVLFHSICNSFSWDKLECVPISNDVYSAKQFWSMAFYYITPEVASVLLNHAFPIKYQVDHLLSRLNQKGIIDVYYVRDVVGMAIYDTDIQAPLI